MKTDEILSALSCIPARDCSYAQRLGIGMALKDTDCACDVWDAWSRDDTHYIEGGSTRRFETIKGGEHPIAVRAIRATARKRGWVFAFTDFADERELTPNEMLMRCLEAVFQPGGIVGCAAQLRPGAKGKLKPINTNPAMKAADFNNRPREENAIDAVTAPIAGIAAHGSGLARRTKKDRRTGT